MSGEISRRHFLEGGALAAAGLLLSSTSVHSRNDNLVAELKDTARRAAAEKIDTLFWEGLALENKLGTSNENSLDGLIIRPLPKAPSVLSFIVVDTGD